MDTTKIDLLSLVHALPTAERGKLIVELGQELRETADTWGYDSAEYNEFRLEMVEIHKLYHANGSPNVTGIYCADPGASYTVIGTVTLTEQHKFTQYSLYPGADLDILCDPQTVELQSNGYYVTYKLVGQATGGGHYFKPQNVGRPEQYHGQVYCYIVDELIDKGQEGNFLQYEIH